MTPLPKRRHSTGRRDRRRAHDALTAPHLIVCSHSFHFGEHTVRQSKQHLEAAGIPVRLVA